MNDVWRDFWLPFGHCACFLKDLKKKKKSLHFTNKWFISSSLFFFSLTRCSPGCVPRARGSPSWPPASPGRVYAWAHLHESWYCRKWWVRGWLSAEGGAALGEDGRRAAGLLDAVAPPALTELDAGDPSASARPRCPLCRQSLRDRDRCELPTKPDLDNRTS